MPQKPKDVEYGSDGKEGQGNRKKQKVEGGKVKNANSGGGSTGF